MNTALVERLRALADFVEQYPNLGTKYATVGVFHAMDGSIQTYASVQCEHAAPDLTYTCAVAGGTPRAVISDLLVYHTG